MEKTFDIVLLLALPASGKSEIRRYLAALPPETLRKDFHLGTNLQLDDFPYVHLMRRMDDELARLGRPRIFFASGEKPFINPGDWGTLLHLLNEDYYDLMERKAAKTDSAARLLMSRVDRAGEKAGVPQRLAGLDPELASAMAAALEKEARGLLDGKHAAYPRSFEGRTIVIEAARGGPRDSAMPLKAPFGYRYSLGELAPEILERAVVLYVWVTPEESRRKNAARTDTNDPGSILHHGVPTDVMMNDYGCDDMAWLEQNSEIPGTITVAKEGRKYHLPVGRFDNRTDKTSFLREDRSLWPEKEVRAVYNALKTSTDRLYSLLTLARK